MNEELKSYTMDGNSLYLIKECLLDWLEENSNSDVNPTFYSRMNRVYKDIKKRWDKLSYVKKEKIKRRNGQIKKGE